MKGVLSLFFVCSVSNGPWLGFMQRFPAAKPCSGVTCTLPNATVSLTLAARPLMPPLARHTGLFHDNYQCLAHSVLRE